MKTLTSDDGRMSVELSIPDREYYSMCTLVEDVLTGRIDIRALSDRGDDE